jgi:3-hydroxyisobutyrate dehydrogenase-like beta-hydroxyacid dehydrogenase
MPGKVGFIGVGNMGRPMALNLLKHDFGVVVYDTNPAAVEPLRAQGASVASAPAEVAAEVERTVSIVATTAQAEQVIAGERGIIHGAGEGHTVLSMSTIDPLAARRLHDRLAAQGIAMLDAPVSGGTVRAASGELSVMVGGDRAVFEACRDIFEAVGQNIFYIGPSGQGLAMKLVNNMLVQTQLVAICEALVVGVKAGLDPQTIYDVVRVSTGTSYGFETRVPRILAGDFTPGGTVDISYKDQELETAFAKQLGVPVLLANVSQQVFQMARAMGFNNEDHAAIIKVLEQFAAVRVRKEQ